MGKHIIVDGQPFTVVNRGGRPYLRSYAMAPAAVAAPPKPIYATQAQIDQIIGDLVAKGLDKPTAESIVGAQFRVRTSGTTNRKIRASGAYKCPFFGSDYITSAGIHHPADCGLNKDGGYTNQTRRDAHIAWAALGAPKH